MKWLDLKIGKRPTWDDGTDDWMRAVDRADELGKTDYLVELLESDTPFGRWARKILADLFNRHNLRKKRGRPRLPFNRVNLTESTDDWMRAVNRAGELGKTDYLVELLESDTPLGPWARKILADLLDRHNLRKKRGKPRLPFNRVNLTEMRMANAVECARLLKQEGHPDPTGEAARRFKWQKDSVDAAIQGKRGSARRPRSPKNLGIYGR
jgi:hypothetical protein